MEEKMKIAFIAIAIVATVAVAGVGVSAFINNDGGSAERPIYNADVNVKIDDEYKSFSGTGKTVKEILESALGEDVKVGANGNVSSYKEQNNDSDHSWVVFRYKTPDGWVNATDDNLAEGVTLALEFSEKINEGGKVTYTKPTLEVKKTVWFFIQVPSIESIEEAVDLGTRDKSSKSMEESYDDLMGWFFNAGLDKATYTKGFWIKGTGSYMNEALVDAFQNAFFKDSVRTTNDTGAVLEYYLNGELVHSHMKSSNQYGWFTDFLGWGDTDIGGGQWTYWTQFTYNPNAPTLDESKQWVFNNWSFGMYDMDEYHYVGLILQTTVAVDKGGEEEIQMERPLPPSTIPEGLKA